MLNILLLEDHSATAQWLQTTARLAFPGARVRHASSLAEARTALQQEAFQLALLDIHLPDGSGTDLIPHARAYQRELMVVMTTVFDDDQHLFEALRAGAQGYLLKEQSQEELVTKLRGIHTGEPPLSPGIARRMLAYFNPLQTHRDPLLSPREQETLTLLAKGFSTKELARLLDISDHTAAGYVKNIYRKLNVTCRAEAALEAVRMGLVRG
ncbi:MAG TPA: response regulator transcription factor [Dongiaceae bacterium]|nr:response regulator transcription factor [Dongiaceae bacterium]